MPTVSINGIPYDAQDGERLSTVLIRCGYAIDHPCGGQGSCGKCAVTVDGQRELACQYTVRGHVRVTLTPTGAVAAAGTPDRPTDEAPVEDAVLALDIGTTTLALALVNPETGEIRRVVTADNPQRARGADVLSRIAYATEHGTADLTSALRGELARMADRLGVRAAHHLTVAGNTTMLHLFLGVNPAPMGTAPYTPVFLEEKRLPGASCGLANIREITVLPGISAFVGADLVAGLHAVGRPQGEGYRLLVDLGTNAEILLIGRDRILCTATAAGPCFEGASISCGMGATRGAIDAYDADGTYGTVGDAPACGICATGLVDAVAVLLDKGVIDATGRMKCPVCYLTEGVSLTREDIRAYQLAKAAVCAGIQTLLQRASLSSSDIERVFVAGGFAAGLRTESAVRTGLLPATLSDRVTAVGNSSLLGACRLAAFPADIGSSIRDAVYVDLAREPAFSAHFMRCMALDRI